MLLEFKIKNYKSFTDEMIFSMSAAPKQRDLEYSVLKQKVGGKEYKALCSAVVYGANASGKTNIIGAMDTLKNIVLRGDILNSSYSNSPNTASSVLELIPNNLQKQKKTVDFEIKFILDDLLVSYSLSLDLGRFLEREYKRKIIEETLKVNHKMIFQRKEGVILGNYKDIKSYLIEEDEKLLESFRKVINKTINQDKLFLVNEFGNLFAPDLVSRIVQWFKEKFIIVFGSDRVRVTPDTSRFDDAFIFVDPKLEEAAKIFGINSNSVGYINDVENNNVFLGSKLTDFEGQEVVIPSDVFESYGTIRFGNIFPLLYHGFINGATVVVDELDASIHPMAIISIANVFHNDELNKNKAQLIFNTHNPIFLNQNFFRRDEIKFVERDDETHKSIHYSLSDFKTFGPKGVRTTNDYIKNYFINRYGAIRDIDFKPIFEQALKDK